jgi:tRNA pseudouridine65 synthase
VVHRSASAGDRDNCLVRVRNQLGRRVYPVHRLDRGTSGVLLFALDPQTTREAAAALQAPTAAKTYLAIVRGWPDESGEIDRPLAQAEGASQAAFTRYARLACAELPHAVGRYDTARYALVRVEPLSGRQHQIRRHLAGIGHPVVGDVNHGDGRHNRFFREAFGVRRLLLHALELSLSHPRSGERLRLQAPVPEELATLLTRLGWLAAGAAGPA